MYNVKLFAGPKANDGSFSIYISFSGADVAYLLTQRKNKTIYSIFSPGVKIEALERIYHENKRAHNSNIIKNTIKHILRVAYDYIEFEKEGGEIEYEDYNTHYRPYYGLSA